MKGLLSKILLLFPLYLLAVWGTDASLKNYETTHAYVASQNTAHSLQISNSDSSPQKTFQFVELTSEEETNENEDNDDSSNDDFFRHSEGLNGIRFVQSSKNQNLPQQSVKLGLNSLRLHVLYEVFLI